MDKLRADLHHAWRSLRQRRAYFITCTATLALVLGANAAIFAVVSATLLRPLPFTAGDRTVNLYMLPPGLTQAHQRNPLQQMDLVRYRERTRTLKRLEGFLLSDRVVMDRSEPTVVKAAAVTPGFLTMLGAPVLQGRSFLPEEERPGHPVVMITHGYWTRVLGGAGVLGTKLVIDGQPYDIVGITPSSFRPTFLDAEIITPLVPDPTPIGRTPPRSVVTIGELADGFTVEQAHGEAAEIVRQLAQEFPRSHGGWTSGAQPAREWQYGTVRTPIIVLFGATAFVLLIACANIANLTSAQASARAGDVALRIALGASRRDIVRLQIAELSLISLAGVVPGLLIAWSAVPALLSLDPEAARSLGSITIDWRVQTFTLLAAVGVAFAAGLIPAIQAFRGSASVTIAEGTRRTAGSRSAGRIRRTLVALEVAVCVALLMAGALLIQGLARLTRMSPGFQSAGILTAQIRLPDASYATADARAAVVDRILQDIRSIPGVEAASTTMNRFVPGFAYQTTFVVENRPRADGQPWAVQFRRVSPDYFKTMRIRELKGRTFTSQDTAAAPHVAVISRLLADELFPGEDAVGRVIRRTAVAAPLTTIIGVVDDVSDVGLTQRPEGTLYLSWQQNNNTAVPVSFVVRTSLDPDSLVPAVRAAVAKVDPGMPLQRVQPLDRFLADSLAPPRFRTTVLGIVAALGLALAALGIYGVTYRGVVDRRHEFAVRLALGASSRNVLAITMGDSLRSVGIGAVIGTLSGIWLCGAITRVLQDASGGQSALTALTATGTLAVCAAAAALIPSIRVLHVQPSDALRV